MSRERSHRSQERVAIRQPIKEYPIHNETLRRRRLYRAKAIIVAGQTYIIISHTPTSSELRARIYITILNIDSIAEKRRTYTHLAFVTRLTLSGCGRQWTRGRAQRLSGSLLICRWWKLCLTPTWAMCRIQQWSELSFLCRSLYSGIYGQLE